jgi:hypothetical protein
MMLDGVKELAPTVGFVGACEALGVPRSSFYPVFPTWRG